MKRVFAALAVLLLAALAPVAPSKATPIWSTQNRCLLYGPSDSIKTCTKVSWAGQDDGNGGVMLVGLDTYTEFCSMLQDPAYRHYHSDLFSGWVTWDHDYGAESCTVHKSGIYADGPDTGYSDIQVDLIPQKTNLTANPKLVWTWRLWDDGSSSYVGGQIITCSGGCG